MNKLVMLSGVPGSGKSYFSNTLKKVKGSHVYIISSDFLRTVVTGTQTNINEDELVFKLFYGLAKVFALDNNGIVVLDATNFSSKKRVNAISELKPLFFETYLISFNIDKQTVSNQNLQREFPIPPDVLERFFDIFEKPTKEDKETFDHIITINDNDIAEAINSITGDDDQIKLFEL